MAGPVKRPLIRLVETPEDRRVWDGVGSFQGRTADELDAYLRSVGYRLFRRVYVDSGPDKGRGGEVWLSEVGFPIRAETRDGVVVRLQRKVAF